MEAAAAVAARADRFSRIAAVARRDVNQCEVDDGELHVVPRLVLEPPWIARRRREMEAVLQRKREIEQDDCVQQVVAMTMGMGEQVGAMQVQLEEQGRQLKSLAVGHSAQTSLQEQLVSLLTTAQEMKPEKEASAPRPHRPSRPYNAGVRIPGQTPQEYHTLTWLSSQRHAAKHYRSALHGYKPSSRRTPFFPNEQKYESGSDRTRTTFGGTRRRSFPRSTCSVPTDPIESRKKKPADDHAKAKQPSTAKRRQVPLVAAMYAKCKRRVPKKPTRGKADKKALPDPPKPKLKHSCAQFNGRKAEAKVESLWKMNHRNNEIQTDESAQLEDSILDTMLSVCKFEDELKHRWLVPDVAEQQKDIGQSIMDEMMSYRNGMTPRIREAVQTSVEKQWPKKEQPVINDDHRDEWICEALIDESLKEVCCELLSFCDEFVEHMFMSEFLQSEEEKIKGS